MRQRPKSDYTDSKFLLQWKVKQVKNFVGNRVVCHTNGLDVMLCHVRRIRL